MSTNTSIKRVKMTTGAQIRRAISSVVSKSAKNFKTKTRRRMLDEIPEGKVYKRPGGFHRASARDQRPAIDEGNLLRSITDTKTSQFAAKVEAEADYAKYLVGEKLNRQIFTGQDIAEAQADFDRDLQKAVEKLS